jgi:hypothetical protein
MIFAPPDRPSVTGSPAALLGFSRQRLNAHQLQSQAAYAVEDAVEVGLVDDLSGEYRLPGSRLHLHPFESQSESLAELLAHHYPVDRTCALASLMLAAALQCSVSVVHNRALCLHLVAYFP